MFGGFTIPVYFALIALFLTVLYWYFTRNHDYWKKVGIPYMEPWPLIGSLILDFKTPLHIGELNRYKKYGKIYGYYEGNRPVLTVGDPELLKIILLKDFQAFSDRRDLNIVDPVSKKMMTVLYGEEWKRIRSIVSPTFSTGKIKRVMGIFEECANILCNNFTNYAKDEKDVNAKEAFGAFTMDVIARSAFSTKLDSLNDPNNQFVQMAKAAFTSGITWRFVLALSLPSIAKLFKIDLFQTYIVNFFRDLTVQIIEERKKTGAKHNDFLQLLLEAHKVSEDEENSENDIAANYEKEGGDEQIINPNYRKKALDENELLAQCVLFFLAGYDTTATTLSLASYSLASNPEVQEKLIAEIDQALQDNQGKLTYEAIQGMKYLDSVISETLRMYPPGSRAERVASRDYTLGNTGITVPKGMPVGIPIHAIHWDPQYYPDPEKFDPERFSDEKRAERQAYTYLPFGGGPRNCVAMRFALMELKTCLATVFSRFRIKLSPRIKLPLEFKITPFILQPKEVLLQFEIRGDVQPTFTTME